MKYITSRIKYWAIGASMVCILLLVYIASAGPILWAVNESYLPNHVLYIYAPLRGSICRESVVLWPIYREYLWCWSDAIPSPLLDHWYVDNEVWSLTRFIHQMVGDKPESM